MIHTRSRACYRMHRNPLARVGKLWILLVSSLLVYLIFLARSRGEESPHRDLQHSIPASGPSSDVYQSLRLSERECKVTFPDLTKDLDATVALGSFTLKQAHGAGPLQARIKDGQVRISTSLTTPKSLVLIILITALYHPRRGQRQTLP